MISRPKLWLAVSIITMLISLGVIVLLGPLWGIDFVGGTLLEIRSRAASTQTIRDMLSSQLGLAATVQTTPDATYIIRTSVLDEAAHERLVDTLQANNMLIEELRFESIGPTIGQELRRKAWMAISLALVLMVIYLAYTFRAAKALVSPWKFGVAAIYALLHDLLLVMALFVVLGKLLGVTIDTLFVTAMLAILGYSVNDTIIIFNRLTAEWIATRQGNLVSVIDRAVKMTLTRSLNTSLTTLVVLICLLVLGGTTIRWFIVALAAGTIVGTYSSIFVAPPLLLALARR